MFLQYLKLAVRLLLRNPFFTLINVTGLAVGIALFLILWQHSQSELQSDAFHRDFERIFRFGLKVQWTDDKVNWQSNTWGTNGPQFTEMVARQYHEVESFTRMFHQNNWRITSASPDHERNVYFSAVSDQADSRRFAETKVAYVDANFFRFFSIPLIQNTEQNVLNSAHAVVLSEKIARKYFGNADAIGETLLLNDTIMLTVTGVFKDLPKNTHLDIDVLLSMERIMNIIPTRGWAVHCYLKLRPQADANHLSARINEDLEAAITNTAWGSWQYGKARVYMQHLSEIAFTSYMLDPHQSKSRFVLLVQGYASFLILIMAWINYTNLTITASRRRLKEIGARKCVGARESDFIFQFLLEGALIHFIAILVAITLIQLMRYPAEVIFNFYIPDWQEISGQVIAMSGTAMVIGILVTASYPAIMALRFSPRNLFGAFRTVNVRVKLPRPAATFQFCIAVVLIIWISAIYKQVNFILNADIGFSKENVMVIDLPPGYSGTIGDLANTFGQKVVNNLRLAMFTVSQSVPGDNDQGWVGVQRTFGDAGMQVESNGIVDENFIPFFGIRLLAGRNFLPDHPADSNSIIISQGTAARLAFTKPEDAVGAKIVVTGNKLAEVIGVIDDYKIRSLAKYGGYVNYGGKPGLAITYKDHLRKGSISGTRKKISFSIAPDKLEESIAVISKEFRNTFPNYIFNWSFLDHVVHEKYRQYETGRNQIFLFTIVAIGIACLGLLGMMTNHVIERTKEIGIRKILGASFIHLSSLLLKSLGMPIVISVSVGIPLAWYLSGEYLAGFYERVSLHWWDYLIPVVFFAMIMFMTIGTVLYKSAKNNPVDALRTE